MRQLDLFTGQPDTVQVRPSLGMTAWMKRKPGYWREDHKRDSKRLTDTQFLRRYCRCKGGYLTKGCQGWSHKDWGIK